MAGGADSCKSKVKELRIEAGVPKADSRYAVEHKLLSILLFAVPVLVTLCSCIGSFYMEPESMPLTALRARFASKVESNTTQYRIRTLVSN